MHSVQRVEPSEEQQLEKILRDLAQWQAQSAGSRGTQANSKGALDSPADTTFRSPERA